MRRLAMCFTLGIGALAVAFTAACKPAPPPAPAPAATGEFRPTATIREIMAAEVSPSADALWDSVATVADATGTKDKRPETDEEWAEVKRSAVTLVEATNLLLIDRHAGRADDKSANPNVELSPAEIDALRARDPETWKMFVKGLYDSAVPLLDAVNKKDANALLASGEALDTACENCHLHYWYPPGKAPAEVPRPSE
jgi:hypothetical protein